MKHQKKISRSQKQELKLSKIYLNQQNANFKISKQNKKMIKNKKVVNPKLFNLPVINNGIKNNFRNVEIDFFIAKKKYENNKNKKNKSQLLKLKKALKREKNIESKEIEQIIKLNSLPKGKVNIINKPNFLIEVKNLSKYYPTKGFITKALSNINLKFEKGSFNIILGESGSGKTTLLNMISGLDRATHGEVIINNINIQALNNRKITLFRRENLGFVFQSYNLLSVLNVRDNIEIGRSLQSNVYKRQNISDLLSKMNIENQDEKMIYELSGGQQQKVSIARAIAKTPQLLIGDEPTGALDQETSKKMFDIFQKINKQYNMTIIIVTHNPNIAKLANQVIKIKDGKIEKIIINKKPIRALEL